MLNKKIILACLVGILNIIPINVYAEDKACVYLESGAGYAAKIRLMHNGEADSWSDSFPIGQSKCVSLQGIPVGDKYTIQLGAVASWTTQDCTPTRTRAKELGTMNYSATGTLFSFSCHSSSGLPEKSPNQLPDKSPKQLPTKSPDCDFAAQFNKPGKIILQLSQ